MSIIKVWGGWIASYHGLDRFFGTRRGAYDWLKSYSDKARKALRGTQND